MHQERDLATWAADSTLEHHQPAQFQSLWTRADGTQRVHTSALLWGQNIRDCPAQD